ncbi:hypothetical protein NE237_028840 [Protea cynaroides]|uniref:Uncharacterized protein n=1 Tax=Protea cynaroides TaxID=273540 RepID=A0A9Q0JVN9_9MAGN|nr:hypothetical protein NE237_028840 [Protea cynaroides]
MSRRRQRSPRCLQICKQKRNKLLQRSKGPEDAIHARASLEEAKSALKKAKVESDKRASKSNLTTTKSEKRAVEVEKRAADFKSQLRAKKQRLQEVEVEDATDQQVEEAPIELEKKVSTEKATEKVARNKVATTEELSEHPRHFMDTEEEGKSFQVEEQQ